MKERLAGDDTGYEENICMILGLKAGWFEMFPILLPKIEDKFFVDKGNISRMSGDKGMRKQHCRFLRCFVSSFIQGDTGV